MTRLRVATFNIRNGLAFDGLNSWPLRRKATAAAIRSLDADVVGLQEVFPFQLRWLRERLPGYQVESAGRRDGRRGEACPLFVRLESAGIAAADTRWFADDPNLAGSRLPGASFPRLATICRLDLLGGRRVDVINTHLDEAVPTNRERSADLLSEWIAPEVPTIVLGDLNAEPHDPPVKRLLRAGLRQALPADAPGTAHDFTGRSDGARIDHVLVSSHFEVLSAEVFTERTSGRLPSDHWPVVADLKLRPGL